MLLKVKLLILIYSMIDFSNIMLILGLLLAFLAVCGYVFIAYIIFQQKRNVKNEYKQKMQIYPTVSAGSNETGADASMKSISVTHNEFRGRNGNILEVYDYDQYVVSGNSMQYCGINDNDLIFVRKGFKISDLRPFPTIIVLSKRNVVENSPKYKLRRAWAYFDILVDNIDEVLRNVLDPQNFKSIRDIEYYDGDKALLEDFYNERLPRYKEKYIEVKNADENDRKVVLSTTFHTNENKVRFSIHPASTIMGIVEESFTVKDSK